MTLRTIETAFARLTLAVLVIYFPVETWASYPSGLWNPFYIVDLIAMALMFWGARRSLNARPAASPAIMCAAYAWTVANGWRATFGRMFELLRGGTLDHGAAEMWVVSIATALGLAALILSFYLVVRSEQNKG
jgi:hypothetical protein